MRKRTLRIEIATSTIVRIVLIAVGIALLTQLVPVILVLITGLMLVGTLSPVVEWLERHQVGRLAAIAIVFAALLMVVAALAVFTVPAFVIQVGSLVEQEPALRAKLVKFLASYPLTTSLAGTLRHLQYGQLFKSYSTEAIAFSRGLFEIVAYGAASIFLALYIMIDRDRLRGALFAVVPRTHEAVAHPAQARDHRGRLRARPDHHLRHDGDLPVHLAERVRGAERHRDRRFRRHCRRAAFRRHLPDHDPCGARGVGHRQRRGHGGVRAAVVL
jgi:predicted PurR-regulated permease PerM